MIYKGRAALSSPQAIYNHNGIQESDPVILYYISDELMRRKSCVYARRQRERVIEDEFAIDAPLQPGTYYMFKHVTFAMTSPRTNVCLCAVLCGLQMNQCISHACMPQICTCINYQQTKLVGGYQRN